MIDNVVLQDSRLSCDALAILCHLLSRPDNWTISVVQLSEHHRICRRRVQQAFNLLHKLGYARLLKVPDPVTGRIGGSRWVISEGPDDHRETENRPLGDGLKGYGSQYVANDLTPRTSRTARDHRETKNRPLGDGLKHYGNQHVASDLTRGAHKHREVRFATVGNPSSQDTKTDLDKYPPKPSPARGASPARRTFEEFEAISPFSPCDSRSRAESEWDRLSEKETHLAIEFARPYADEAKRCERKLCSATKYLRERRWESMAMKRKEKFTAPRGEMIWIEKGSAEYDAWWSRARSEGRTIAEHFSAIKGAIGFERKTRWPPDITSPSGGKEARR